MDRPKSHMFFEGNCDKARCPPQELGPISYHLGMDYFRNKDGTLVACPKKYIEKMLILRCLVAH